MVRMKLKTMQIPAKRKERDHTDDARLLVSRINQQISFLRSLMARIDSSPLSIREHQMDTMHHASILNRPILPMYQTSETSVFSSSNYEQINTQNQYTT